VQPKLSASAASSAATILGDRTFAMRIWLKPDQMAAHGISPPRCASVGAQQLPVGARANQGSMVSVNLIANTDLRTPEEFRQLVVKQQHGVVVRLGDIADVVLGAENYEQDVRFNGETATFMGVWVLPTANSLDVIGRVREAILGNEAQLPTGMKVGIPYDRPSTSRTRSQRCSRRSLGRCSSSSWSSSCSSARCGPVLIPVVAIPISLVGAVFLMLVPASRSTC